MRDLKLVKSIISDYMDLTMHCVGTSLSTSPNCLIDFRRAIEPGGMIAIIMSGFFTTFPDAVIAAAPALSICFK